MIKYREKFEHSREEIKESVGSEEMSGENRDSLIEPMIQGMRDWMIVCCSQQQKNDGAYHKISLRCAFSEVHGLRSVLHTCLLKHIMAYIKRL